MEDGYTKEEWKMMMETKKILDPKIKLTATCVRVPVFVGHSEAVNIEFENPISADEARDILRNAPGCLVIDKHEPGGYVTPYEAAGEDATYISRIREDADGGERPRAVVRVGQSAQGRGAERDPDRRMPDQPQADQRQEKSGVKRVRPAGAGIAMTEQPAPYRPNPALKRVERGFENVLFNSRWLMAPFYVGLVVSLAVLLLKFLHDAVGVHPACARRQGDRHHPRRAVSLIDVSLVGNLILIVVFSGYENFVSRIDPGGHPDWPDWMTKVDFAGLKQKLLASIVAISAIQVLEGVHEHRCRLRRHQDDLAGRRASGVRDLGAAAGAVGSLGQRSRMANSE